MIPIRTSVEVQDVPGAVVGLIIANVAVFLVQSGLPSGLAEQFILHNALVPASYTDPELARELGLDPGNPLPLLTNIFMHVGWPHLLVNMWTLWLFGRPLEERLGTPRFILFYLASGVVASLAHLAFNLDSPVPALGASGAIAGILGGYTLLYPWARVLVLTPVLFFPAVFALPAAVYTALWFVFQLLPGLTELFAPQHAAGIAWWAHIGGFLAGLALIRLVGRPRRRAREIGPTRVGMREIGEQHPRVKTVGAQHRHLVDGPFRRWKAGLSSPRRDRWRRDTHIAPAATPAAKATPDEAFAEKPRQEDAAMAARRRGPWG